MWPLLLAAFMILSRLVFIAKRTWRKLTTLWWTHETTDHQLMTVSVATDRTATTTATATNAITVSVPVRSVMVTLRIGDLVHVYRHISTLTNPCSVRFVYIEVSFTCSDCKVNLVVPPSAYIVGNELLSSEFVADACLSQPDARHGVILIGSPYVLHAIDNDLVEFSLSPDQFVRLGADSYSVIDQGPPQWLR